MLTIGPQTLTLTATPAAGDTSATLTVAWPSTSISTHQLVTFSSGDQRNVSFTQGSTTITWQSPLTATATTSISCIGVQAYPLPANVSKIKSPTITIGQLVYSPAPVQSIQEWVKLNALPYTSSIPAYFFLYNGELQFWPIPAASGEVITLNAQINVADMTYEDYTTPGTIASSGMVVNSNLVTGSSTTWASSFPTGTDLTFANLNLIANPPQGDGLPYQVQSIQNNTALTLTRPVVNVPVTTGGGTFTIGQYPLLQRDFHDILVYWALRVYYSSIVPDANRYQLFNGIYEEKIKLMEYYLANKQTNVDLSVSPVLTNPNLFFQGNP
jgi:hypothetical protein